MSADWFAAPVCRNCDAACTTPYCATCGQKAATRYLWRDIGKEAWERLRLFEFRSARTLGRLLLSPGGVARDYVRGKRSTYMNPLTLLVALVALLVVMLAANRYFAQFGYAAHDADMDRMAQRVIAYANWSFSLGIVATFAASWTLFGRRLGYNPIEHAVLALFCQNVVIAIILVNLLPTLVWRNAGFILWHKAASQYYIPAIKLLVVAIAYKQFFLLDLDPRPYRREQGRRSDWPRLMAACGVFAGLNWVLLRLYAIFILWLVGHTN